MCGLCQYRNPNETKTMIPKEGNDLLELHLDRGRKAECDVLAERMLVGAEAILGYALACNHLSPVEYGGRIASVKLIRAQRDNRNIELSAQHAGLTKD